MDSLSYILEAAAAEETNGIESAFDIAQKGYEAFPDNYELVFMLGGYSFCMENPEMAYVYYLLAESLCDTEDKKIISENKSAINTDLLNAELVRKLLNDVILHRLKLRAYDKTYTFVSDILFSDDQFLFQKISDKWLRYYLIILEITSCEKNRALVDYTADHYADWKEFETILCKFKFAFRRIWFGFPADLQLYLKTLVEQYHVSPEFVVIMGKYAVHEDYLANALSQAAKLLYDENDPLMSQVICNYADWFSHINKNHQPVMPLSESYDNGMKVIFVDAADSSNSVTTNCNDTKKEFSVSYIMCANNDLYVEEVLMYLRRQKLPENFEMKVYVVCHAKSMAAGYNVAMNLSPSTYKIYIHQDTFIFDPEYTKKIIAAFKSSHFDMLGLAGTEKMPSSGKWWDSESKDMHLHLYQDFVIHIIDAATDEKETTMLNVVCLDGVLIATREDVPWRDDLFTNFHFYDISQGYEFTKRNFKIGFYNNPVAGGGVLHEVSVSKDVKIDTAYETSREIFNHTYR